MMPAPLPLVDPILVILDGTPVATWTFEPPGHCAGDVVLCHGTPWSSQVWAEVARHLSRDYRVRLWDMPGYGFSQGSEDTPLDLATQARRLVALLEQWELARPHLVAHDIGGAIALRAHLLHGADFASLYLWDCVTLDPWGSPFFSLVQSHSDVFTALPPTLHGALVREYIAGAGQLSPEWIDRLSTPWVSGPGQALFYRQIRALSPDHTREIVPRLGSMRCPVRIGWGTEDSWLPFEQTARLRALLAGMPEIIEIQGTGHLPQVERPTEVGISISRWLDCHGTVPNDPTSERTTPQ